jgi:hypothetical protein
MSTAVVKAITRRIRLRMGGTREAALAADVAPSVWSGYENADDPDKSIPLHRLVAMPLTTAERRAIAALFANEDDAEVFEPLREVGEAIESVAELHKMVRLATIDGSITETEKRAIRAKCLETTDDVADVMKAVS